MLISGAFLQLPPLLLTTTITIVRSTINAIETILITSSQVWLYSGDADFDAVIV